MSRWFVGSLLLTVTTWLVWLAAVWHGDLLPEKVPVHWDINLQIDGWGSGSTALQSLAFLPGLMTFILAINAVLPHAAPEPLADPVTRSKLDFTIFTGLLFFLTLGAVIVVGMTTGEFPVRILIGAAFVFLGLLGAAMRGIKPNLVYGVRTPWTLGNDSVWNRTHDFTAVFEPAIAAFGLLMVVAGVPLLWCLIVVAPAILGPVVASYVFARNLAKPAG